MINSCAAIVIAAKHGELIKVKDASGIAYTVGTLRCKFEFRTTDWNYTTRTAVFCKGNISTNQKVVDTAIGVILDGVDECAVPPEVLLPDEKYFSVGVWGVTNDGLRIVSEWLVFRIKDGCYVNSAESFLPTPSVYEQLLISLNLKAPIDHKHEEYVTEEELNDKHYTTETFIEDTLKEYVQKVDGKGLSTNDYTNEEKEELAKLSSGVAVADAIEKLKAEYIDPRTQLTYDELNESLNIGTENFGGSAPTQIGTVSRIDNIKNPFVFLMTPYRAFEDGEVIFIGDGLIRAEISDMVGDQIVVFGMDGSSISVGDVIYQVNAETYTSTINGTGVKDKGARKLIDTLQEKNNDARELILGCQNSIVNHNGRITELEKNAVDVTYEHNENYQLIDTIQRIDNVANPFVFVIRKDSGVKGGDKLYLTNLHREITVDAVLSSGLDNIQVVTYSVDGSVYATGVEVYANYATSYVTHINNIPIKNSGSTESTPVDSGVGKDSIQQKADGVSNGFDFTNKNPNATELDSTMTGIIPYGATGDYASSFGGKSAAQGKRSMSTGTTTIAKGKYSFTAGENTVALGDSSLAEGMQTTSVGYASHAQNALTVAKGAASHAQNYMTQALGDYSTAGGIETTAEGIASAAFGRNTNAKEDSQFVVGRYNSDDESAIFIVGNGNDFYTLNAFEVYNDGRASVSQAPKEEKDVVRLTELDVVNNTLGSRINSLGLSEGYGNTVIQKSASMPTYAESSAAFNQGKVRNALTFAAGVSAEASGYGAAAFGVNSIASGDYSFVAGESTRATRHAQFSVGIYNTQDDDALFIVGNGNASGRSNAFVVKTNGDANVKGTMRVAGDLVVAGTTKTQDTETVLVKNNVVVANSDGLDLVELGGFALKTDKTNAYGIMYDPNGNGVKIGLGAFDANGKFTYSEGQAQFLATRADTIIDGHTVVWDDNAKQLVDSGVDHSEYVKFTDYMSQDKAGVAKLNPNNSGMRVVDGVLKLYPSSPAALSLRPQTGVNYNETAPITAGNLNFAVIAALTDDKRILMTDEEKAIACETIGAVGFNDIAGNQQAGLVAPSATYGTGVTSSGVLTCQKLTLEEYKKKTDACFISKATLENVLAEKAGTKLYKHFILVGGNLFGIEVINASPTPFTVDSFKNILVGNINARLTNHRSEEDEPDYQGAITRIVHDMDNEYIVWYGNEQTTMDLSNGVTDTVTAL